jgi:thiol-disulfide isomerase/thioredoxin
MTVFATPAGSVRLGLIALTLGVASLLPQQSRSGTELDLADYRGQVVVVDFWASWCVPCRRSFPWLNEMQAKYADDGLVVIGVNVDANADDARAFLAEFPVDFRIVEDSAGELARSFDVIAMPSSYIIDRDGEIVERHLGFKVKRKDEYEQTIQQTLGVSR